MIEYTFENIGLKFEENSSCVTCDGLSCHNNVEHINGLEYNVHISTKDKIRYSLDATTTSNSEDNQDLYMRNLSEQEIVKFLCDNFHSFKCF